MFTVKALHGTLHVVVNWNNGLIETTPPGLAKYIHEYAEACDGKSLGPVNMPARWTNRLANREAAFVLLYNVLDSILSVTGDVPVFDVRTGPRVEI